MADGSSPLAWGIQAPERCRGCRRTVHPHSRGVYPLQLFELHFCDRFIPTRVGYTYGFQRIFQRHVRFIPTRVGYTQRQRRCPPHRLRFIPTRVGYTQGRRRNRVCALGSSPLAWGIRYGGGEQCFPVRFIPTRVGYTEDSVTRAIKRYAVHPHSRGVYSNRAIFRIVGTSGSSPLAWGIRQGAALPKCLPCGSSPLAWGIHKVKYTDAWCATVHPHSRGVYFLFNRKDSAAASVHPHSRGVYTKKIVDFTGFL